MNNNIKHNSTQSILYKTTDVRKLFRVHEPSLYRYNITIKYQHLLLQLISFIPPCEIWNYGNFKEIKIISKGSPQIFENKKHWDLLPEYFCESQKYEHFWNVPVKFDRTNKASWHPYMSLWTTFTYIYLLWWVLFNWIRNHILERVENFIKIQ